MGSFAEFESAAPHIAEIFRRRHAATGNLCFLGTIRADGYPRISPLEPQLVDGQLALVGMPGTRKFGDLTRDGRFSLHTATVDTQVGEGDAKVWGQARPADDPQLRQQLASIYEQVEHEPSEQDRYPMFVADIVGASSLEVVDGRLRITVWKEGSAQRQMFKD